LSIAVRDDDVVEITLERGWNTLLVKVTNHTDEHGLFARLSQDPLELARAFDQNEQWDKALTYFDRALEADPGNSSILFSRGRASLKSGRRQLAEESFAEALDLIGENTSSYRTMAGLYDEDAQSLLAAGRSAEAVVSLDRSRELYERVLQGESALPQDAAGLAEVMLAGSQPQWTVVTPSEATGQAGETLIVEEDGGAIFVSGPNPKRAIYTLKFPLDEIGPVTAIRLETLPDARLPHGGAGRYPGNGNFHLAEITAAIETGDDGPEPQLIPIVDALADHFAGQGLSPRQAFDEDPKTRWDTDAQYSMPHWAVFAFRLPMNLRHSTCCSDDWPFPASKILGSGWAPRTPQRATRRGPPNGLTERSSKRRILPSDANSSNESPNCRRTSARSWGAVRRTRCCCGSSPNDRRSPARRKRLPHRLPKRGASRNRCSRSNRPNSTSDWCTTFQTSAALWNRTGLSRSSKGSLHNRHSACGSRSGQERTPQGRGGSSFGETGNSSEN
jgi:hypothetical protein